MLKRFIDFVAALLLFALLSPLVATTALVIAWRMGSPVLFRQQRPGLHGQPFMLMKFRTMLDAVDANGLTLPDSSRLTPLGRLAPHESGRDAPVDQRDQGRNEPRWPSTAPDGIPAALLPRAGAPA